MANTRFALTAAGEMPAGKHIAFIRPGPIRITPAFPESPTEVPCRITFKNIARKKTMSQPGMQVKEL
jgi:hypothetical protein